MFNKVIALVFIIILTACSPEENMGNMSAIEANPSIVDVCSGDEAIVTEIRWKVVDPAVDTVRIEITRVGDETRKVFYVGPPMGQMLTEKWVRTGMVFILINHRNDEVIDAIEMRGHSC